MIRYKVCMLGAFATGKTSLVNRFAHGLFSEAYHTTIGVRVERKTVETADSPVDLIIWDIHGEDEFQKVRSSYLRGAAGCLIVVDVTRAETVDVGLRLLRLRADTIGAVPSVVLLNKADLRDQWDLGPEHRERLVASGVPFLETSALTGAVVDEAFRTLVDSIRENGRASSTSSR